MTDEEKERALRSIQERFAAYLEREPAAVISFPQQGAPRNKPAAAVIPFPERSVEDVKPVAASAGSTVSHLLDRRIWPKLLKNYDTEWLPYGANRYRRFSLNELNCTRERLVASARRLFCECLKFSRVDHIRAGYIGEQGTVTLELPEAEYHAKKSDILEYVQGAKSERNR